jgi:hypothetical protein
MSKTFYMGSIFGGVVLSVIIVVGAVMAAAADPNAGGALVPLAFVPIFFSVVMWYVLIYKMWSALPLGWGRTTPGKAVALMFVPLFNVYWFFQIWWGWAKDYNRYAGESNADLPRMSEGLALTMCILVFLSAIPLVNLVSGIALLVVQIILVSKVINAVNALCTQGRRATPSVPSLGVAPQPAH